MYSLFPTWVHCQLTISDWQVLSFFLYQLLFARLQKHLESEGTELGSFWVHKPLNHDSTSINFYLCEFSCWSSGFVRIISWSRQSKTRISVSIQALFCTHPIQSWIGPSLSSILKLLEIAPMHKTDTILHPVDLGLNPVLDGFHWAKIVSFTQPCLRRYYSNDFKPLLKHLIV